MRDYAHERLSRINSLRIIGTAPGKGAIVSFELQGIHAHDVSMVIDRSGVAVRAGTPMEHVRALQQAVRRAILSPEVRTKYGEFGIIPDGSTPEEFQATISGETKRWHPLIKELGIKLD